MSKAIYTTFGLVWLCAAASAADADFLKKACEGGMTEVKLGELARTSASDPQVKDFAQRLVVDHTRMGKDVRDLAAKQNVSVPTEDSLKDSVAYTMLSGKSGSDFDKAYISTMIKDHQADIVEFQKEADSGSDPEAKAVAASALPTIKEHLRMAQSIAKRMGTE